MRPVPVLPSPPSRPSAPAARPARLAGLAVAVLALAAGPGPAGAQMDLSVKTSPKLRMNIGGSNARRSDLVAVSPASGASAPAAASGPAPSAASGASAPPPRGRPERARTARAGARAASAPPDPMERLRARLAQTLGAESPDGGNRYVMRVSTHGESGETTVSARAASAAGHATAPASAPRHATTSGTAATAAAHAGGPVHWAYSGAEGPEAWARLKPEFATCGTGSRQSPIDIRGGIAVDLAPIQFDYRPSAFGVIDNGHTVQVNVAPGNAITVLGRRWELVQFHFHRPSEERIDGRQFDMVVHLVHKDAEGKLAVVAVLLDRGSAQPIVQAIWNNLPLEKGEELKAPGTLDLEKLLPEDRRYYTYMGSLTTPPCTEGVLWMVLKQPVGVSEEQVGIFSRLYPMNARPVQAMGDRLIKQSD